MAARGMAVAAPMPDFDDVKDDLAVAAEAEVKVIVDDAGGVIKDAEVVSSAKFEAA